MKKHEELSLKSLRQIELDLLNKLRTFCDEHNLQYFLSNGTLLGAVKYQGFIPWDDDIDILIPRKDYDILIEKFEDFGNYKLFSHERVSGYAFPFAKLCDMTTRKEETNNNNGVELGVDIDIFPLDMWNDDAIKQAKKQMNTMTMLRLAKNYDITAKNPLKSVVKKVTAIFCKILGSSFWVKRMHQHATETTDKSDNVGCIAWPVYGLSEIIPAKAFSDTVEVMFEGEKCPAPIGYDAYLRSLYGDYVQDPPLEKQKTHHRFSAYRI